MNQFCTAPQAQPHAQPQAQRAPAQGQHSPSTPSPSTPSPGASSPRKAHKPQPFDLEALLQEVATVFNAAAHGRPVEIVFDIDTMLPRYLVGDASSLKQVLFSLGSNAIRATAQGEITVAVEVEQMSTASVNLVFSLRDTGSATVLHMAAAQRHAGGADAAITWRFAGTPEDLDACLRLVDQLGGELELMSPAQGAGHFQLCLAMRRDRSRPSQVSVAADIRNSELPWPHVSSVLHR